MTFKPRRVKPRATKRWFWEALLFFNQHKLIFCCFGILESFVVAAAGFWYILQALLSYSFLVGGITLAGHLDSESGAGRWSAIKEVGKGVASAGKLSLIVLLSILLTFLLTFFLWEEGKLVSLLIGPNWVFPNVFGEQFEFRLALSTATWISVFTFFCCDNAALVWASIWFFAGVGVWHKRDY